MGYRISHVCECLHKRLLLLLQLKGVLGVPGVGARRNMVLGVCATAKGRNGGFRLV